MIRIIFFLLLTSPIFAQTIDTTQVFSLEKYLEWVRVYHPVMQQAALLENRGDAALLEARGGFDPKLFGSYEDKSFDQKNYFRIGEAGLKVPLWWGMDVKLAYLWTSGDFLNSENKLPKNGQAVIGVEIPLLQGLAFDQRRAQVQQARLFQNANAATRRTIVNDLLQNAIETYWTWAYRSQVVAIYESTLVLSETRLDNIRESFRQGDKPAIDTLESMIQVQNRTLDLAQARVEFSNATLSLSNFLWYEDLVPLEVSENLRPENLENIWNPEDARPTSAFLQNLSQTHPDLQRILIKQQELDLKEKLKREQFKPQLNFNYNFLGEGFDWTGGSSDASPFNNLVTENYKWGLELSYPILMRKARGGLELVRLEQLDNRYKLGEKQLQISNKITTIFQQIETTFSQLSTSRNMVENYERLLAAENEKFRIGESSIFLLNSREQKLIDAQLKLNKLQVEFQKLRWKLEGAKGELR